MITALRTGLGCKLQAGSESMSNEDRTLKEPSSRGVRWAQVSILVVLYLFPVILSLRNSPVSDPDVWFHLRTGEWIMQHHAFPRTEPFSSIGAGKPWVAYSWLYELLIFKLFQWLGLVGLAVYTAGLVLCIVVALHRLIRQLGSDFTVGVLLTAVAVMSMTRIYTPRPWLFTILFFLLELDLLMKARKTGEIKGLLLLPILFAVWANVHIQFVGGIVVLALALFEVFLARRLKEIPTRLQYGWFSGIFVLCILATLANPYGWRVYQVVHELASESGELSKVVELSALPFRRLDDWLVLFLALAAAAMLARASKVVFFETALLMFAVYASFRSQRDLWVIVIVASLILAEGIRGDDKNGFLLKASAAPIVAIVLGLAVLLSFRIMHMNNERLGADLAKYMPADAVDAIKQNGWNGPLYNDYTWGGYLMWALRIPVSTDGRQNVYGDVVLDRSYATWNGQPGWDRDPDLLKANLVIGPINAPLTQLLRLDSHFRLAYEDKVAAVFLARTDVPAESGTSAPGACPQVTQRSN